MRSISVKTCTQNLNLVLDRFLKEHWAVSSVLLWSGVVCAAAAMYVTIGIHWWSAALLGIIAVAAIFFLIKKYKFEVQILPQNFSTRAVLFTVIVCDFILAYTVWHTRTNAALRSPWEHIGISFFILFGCATALLAAALYNNRPTILSFFASITHVGLFYSIALIAFRFGYAYDPLIHQAAENYVVQHGRIMPIQPFYIGQYALAAMLHFISSAPVNIIDRLLVPILATISIPTLGYVGLTRGWKIPAEYAQLATLSLLLYPIAEFTFTVPHNLTVLYLLWWLLLAPLALKTPIGRVTLAVLSAATLVTHPLIGAPICIATLCAYLLHRFEQRLIAIIAALLIGASSFAMLSLYRVQHGAPFIEAFSFSHFVSVFEFHYAMSSIRPALQLLYGYNFLLPYALTGLGIFVAIRFSSAMRAVRWSILALIAGIFISIFLISTLISIPGVLDYEQSEFVLRLHSIIPLFIIPFIAYGSYELCKKNIYTRIVVMIGMGALATTSLYFTYPRTDGSMHPGWNVSHGDLDVVRALPELTSSPYVVLSNQILAVTGLREHGFENQSRFAISTNEQQFSAAQQVLYTELNGSDLRTYAEQIHGSIFVAVEDYWYRVDEIANEARIAGPDKTYRFDGITLYEFR